MMTTLKRLSYQSSIFGMIEGRFHNHLMIWNEMKFRYKENLGDDRLKITMAFKESSVGDQTWVEHQERKEMYGK